MKKLLALVLCLLMVVSVFSGCQSESAATPTEAPAAEKPAENAAAEEPAKEAEPAKLDLVRMAATPFSGNVLIGIAQDKGFFAEEGIEVELQLIQGTSNAQATLAAGHVDVLTTYGTSPALDAIIAGTDITVFGGYMLQGCMPILAREGTEWNGVEDMIGKRVIGENTSKSIICRGLRELGYENPTELIEWVPYVDDNTNMELIRKGECDYMRGTTGLHTRAFELGLDLMCFAGDIYPEYSCCRIWSNTSWLEENRDVAVRLMKALIRAQAVLESDPDYGVEIVVEQTDLTKEYAEGFIKNDALMIRLDPHWKGVSGTWEANIEFGLQEDAPIELLKEHFTPEVYKEALDAAKAEHYDEFPEFYDYYLNYFEEVNAGYYE